VKNTVNTDRNQKIGHTTVDEMQELRECWHDVCLHFTSMEEASTLPRLCEYVHPAKMIPILMELAIDGWADDSVEALTLAAIRHRNDRRVSFEHLYWEELERIEEQGQ